MTYETKHTPGPWIYRPQIAGQKGVVDCGTRIVCEMPYTTMINQPEVDTNARLIAAAPELLAALALAGTTIRRVATQHPGSFSSVEGTLSVISDAIAKAEGR